MQCIIILSLFGIFEFFFIKDVVKTLSQFDRKRFSYSYIGASPSGKTAFLRCDKKNEICQNPKIIEII